MVKTLRISDKTHEKMMRVQGRIQQKSGKSTSINDVITILIKEFKKNG